MPERALASVNMASSISGKNDHQTKVRRRFPSPVLRYFRQSNRLLGEASSGSSQSQSRLVIQHFSNAEAARAQNASRRCSHARWQIFNNSKPRVTVGDYPGTDPEPNPNRLRIATPGERWHCHPRARLDTCFLIPRKIVEQENSSPAQVSTRSMLILTAKPASPARSAAQIRKKGLRASQRTEPPVELKHSTPKHPHLD